ncbi:MAG TPA: pilus assembly protein [Pseudomonas sp.]|nr:pilus assembly protein [Pseudomonas sp.]
MNSLHRSMAILTLAALSLPSVGAENMLFTGQLLAPPSCTVSDKGGRIDVHFERNIAVNRIDGERYRQTIPYQIDCPGANESGFTWHMRVTLKGTDAGFDPAALHTSEKNLGIKVLLGGTPLIPNKPREISIYGAALPVMEAVPVKLAGAKLPSTQFTASALLMAEIY